MTLELDDFDLFSEPDDSAEQRVVVVEKEPRKCRHPRIDRTRTDDGGWSCVCGHVAAGAMVRRGRNVRARGNRIQRQKIVGLGGRNLAGNNPNLDGLGVMFRYESKSAVPGNPPSRKLRIPAFPETLWALLRGIPAQAHQTRVLIVTEAPGPGRKARSLVVVDYDDWRELHGENR